MTAGTTQQSQFLLAVAEAKFPASIGPSLHCSPTRTRDAVKEKPTSTESTDSGPAISVGKEPWFKSTAFIFIVVVIIHGAFSQAMKGQRSSGVTNESDGESQVKLESVFQVGDRESCTVSLQDGVLIAFPAGWFVGGFDDWELDLDLASEGEKDERKRV
ncbi:hypothetical protein HDU97_003930 [Phlyctochytrium planicorne]|nr:hypothetical protein HDU97_003930 [Phlyctochytrium planicorne]